MFGLKFLTVLSSFVAISFLGAMCVPDQKKDNKKRVGNESKRYTKYEVKKVDNGTYKVIVENGPSFFHSLDMAPAKMEPFLTRGTWLVCLCAQWGKFDIRNLPDGEACASEYQGRIQYGVRVFVNYEENEAWLPQNTELTRSSPVWLVIHNGKILACECSFKTEKELRRIVNQSLAQITDQANSGLNDSRPVRKP